MNKQFELSQKVIVITGASSGIGKAAAIYFSARGAQLALIARSEEKLREVLELCNAQSPDKSVIHRIYPYDLNDNDGIRDLVKKIVSDFGPVAGFFHSAGISVMRPLKLLKPDCWNEIMQVNLLSFIELIRCFARKGNAVEGASFVGMSSVASTGCVKSQLQYAASKAAMDAVIRTLSKELAAKKIKVNTIRSDLVKTEIFHEYCAQYGDCSERFPFGVIEPDKIAAAATFLISDENQNITGTTIRIDSGNLGI